MIPAEPLAEYALDDDDGGFVASGEIGQWRWGEVRNGPGAGFDSPRAWAVGLTASYLNDSVDELEIPIPDLSGAARPMLRFTHWFDIAAGDAGWIEIDQGAGFEVATPIYGYPQSPGYTGRSGGWEEVTVDLSTAGTSPRVRLVFSADASLVAAGWFVDRVGIFDGDVAAPHVGSLTSLADTEDLDGPYVVEAEITDDQAVAQATLVWSVGGSAADAAMTGVGDRWRGEIPGQKPDTQVDYFIRASDGANVTVAPAGSARSFRVYLPSPTGLEGPEGRFVATVAPLSWAPPASAHLVAGYRVYRDEAVVAESVAAEATVPLVGENDTFHVRAVYDLGTGGFVEGDPSGAVSVDAVVPEIDSIEPSTAYAGDALHVTLRGRYLLLAQGSAALSLGEGVTIDAVDVRDANTLVADVRVDATAASGPRTATLVTAASFVQAEGGFVVEGGASRPRLTDLAPERIEQGETGEIVISFVGELAGLPTADLGDGIVVEAVVVGEGEVVVTYACAGNAPIGEHPVRLDDGVRIFDGVVLTVEDFSRPIARTCGGGTAPGLCGLLVGFAFVRRSRRT